MDNRNKNIDYFYDKINIKITGQCLWWYGLLYYLVVYSIMRIIYAN